MVLKAMQQHRLNAPQEALLTMRIWHRDRCCTLAMSSVLMEREQASSWADLLLMSRCKLSLLTLRSPSKTGVSKGEAPTRASWFEMRRKGDAPHHEDL
jgi:hypothetical protein